jgi:hypothetical protein
MLNELCSDFQLLQVSSAQTRSMAMIEILQQAAGDQYLVANLHGTNDEIQRGLMALTNDLATSFFGYSETTQASQSQSQA